MLHEGSDALAVQQSGNHENNPESIRKCCHLSWRVPCSPRCDMQACNLPQWTGSLEQLPQHADTGCQTVCPPCRLHVVEMCTCLKVTMHAGVPACKHLLRGRQGFAGNEQSSEATHCRADVSGSAAAKCISFQCCFATKKGRPTSDVSSCGGDEGCRVACQRPEPLWGVKCSDALGAAALVPRRGIAPHDLILAGGLGGNRAHQDRCKTSQIG